MEAIHVSTVNFRYSNRSKWNFLLNKQGSMFIDTKTKKIKFENEKAKRRNHEKKNKDEKNTVEPSRIAVAYWAILHQSETTLIIFMRIDVICRHDEILSPFA